MVNASIASETRVEDAYLSVSEERPAGDLDTDANLQTNDCFIRR